MISYSVILIQLLSHLWKGNFLSWNRLKIAKWSKVYNMEKMYISPAFDIYYKSQEIDGMLKILSKYAEFDVALVVLTYIFSEKQQSKITL